MLTHHDATIDDPLAVYREVRDCGLRYVGFKDIGAPVATLREVCAAAHADGLEVMLEVVSTTREEELTSAAAAADIGVDWLLGGTHPGDVLKVIDPAAARYCPFPGTVVGHPSVLRGEIAEDAASGPVIAAGSVTSTAQITALDEAGAWGFTIGGAIFEGRLPGGPSVAGQVRVVLRAAGTRDAG